jgi:hypothetical protein
MSRGRRLLAGGVALVVAAAVVIGGLSWRRRERAQADEHRLGGEVAALEAEREALQRRLDERLPRDASLAGMPRTDIRFGVPSSLTRALVERVVAGLVDQVTLVLEDIKVRKTGEIRKLVSLGRYELDVTIDRVEGRLRTGSPTLEFGGNRVRLALPVSVASGSGKATVRFKWDGRNVAGAVCGDLDLTREVSGGVKPATYPLGGSLVFSSTREQIVVTPRLPRLTVRLKVVPSPESWAAVRKVVEDQRGVCGFVLDRVDILDVVQKVVEKGFHVRLPTDRLRPMAVPVAIQPEVTIKGRALSLEVRVSGLAVTADAIWLGADVGVGSGG